MAEQNGRSWKVLLALWIVAGALGAAAVGIHRTRIGEWKQFWREAPLTGITHETGFAFEARTGRPELSSHLVPSSAEVRENGIPLGSSNAQHSDIRQVGGGRFSFWHDYVYFSTSDGSDPRTNGRAYTFAYPPITATAARVVYLFGFVALLLSAALTLVATIPYLSAASLRAIPAEVTRRLAALARLFPRSVGSHPGAALGVLWGVTALMLISSGAVYLTRTGQWTRPWRQEALTDIRPEIGHAFTAHTGRPELSSHIAPSPAEVLEDGRPLPIREGVHAGIRRSGAGRYSFWYDYVYFSTTDNSDPRTNGRRYAIFYPPVTRFAARALYLSSVVMLILAAVFSVALVAAGHLGAWPAVWAHRVAGQVGWIAAGVSAAGVASVGVMRATRSLSPVLDEWWPLILAIEVAAAIVMRIRWNKRLRRDVLVVHIAALAVALWCMVAIAPNRTEGCHTTEPYTAWEIYCVSPDSASYYTRWAPGSTRQPLYPWFIQAISAGTGFDPKAFMASVKPGEVLGGSASPLFRVVHVQIVLLLAAALIACWWCARFTNSIVPAIGFAWMYDHQFFTAVELNNVLTETFVQALTFLLVAAFFAFLYRPRSRTLIAGGALCGLLYIARQATAYTGLMFAAMILVGLAVDRSRYIKAVIVSIVLAALVSAVPDLYAFAVTGRLEKQQDSLQYQYRIVHAVLHAQPGDEALMPDPETRAWLLAAIPTRDAAHRSVDEKYSDEYNRMIYYVNDDLYKVAMPPGDVRTPQFYMSVATPVLEHHWKEYLRFSFRFWLFAVTRPGLARLGGWTTYLWLLAGMLWLRDRAALAACTLVLCHWLALALTCMFAAPIQRMVWASEFLVVIAVMVVAWGAVEKLMTIVGRSSVLKPAEAWL